jgi:hypothetical protein
MERKFLSILSLQTGRRRPGPGRLELPRRTAARRRRLSTSKRFADRQGGPPRLRQRHHRVRGTRRAALQTGAEPDAHARPERQSAGAEPTGYRGGLAGGGRGALGSDCQAIEPRDCLGPFPLALFPRSRLNSARYGDFDHHSASWPSTYRPGVNASGRPAAWPGKENRRTVERDGRKMIVRKSHTKNRHRDRIERARKVSDGTTSSTALHFLLRLSRGHRA